MDLKSGSLITLPRGYLVQNIHNRNMSVNCLLQNIFFSACLKFPQFRECSATFNLSTLGPETEERIKLTKNKICFDFYLLKADSGVSI